MDPIVVTSIVVDTMDKVAFTIVFRQTSPPQIVTGLRVRILEFADDLEAVDIVVDIVLDSTLGEGGSSHQLPQKGLQ